ncbi:MAG TPA: type II CAAX endopeptidase family protein [Candidatus Eisenbacteria bacterium]|nr:type II CAAX endopeptidase family protein [Candidatus Eisenbacteria bacterium]
MEIHEEPPLAPPPSEPPSFESFYQPSQPPDPRSTAPVAPAWHSAIVLAYLGIFTWLSAGSVPEEGLPPGMSRVALYVPVLLFQWILFGLCWWGLRLGGVSVRGVLASRWRGLAGFGRAIAVAAVFWVATFVLIASGMELLGVHEPEKNKLLATLLLPRAPLEYAVWAMVALTAGFVEEVVFRGYLQRQFTAWFRHHGAGIALSAAVFAAGHLYQGIAAASVIAVIGLSFGVLAYLTRSLVPGVYAHAWADLYPAIMGRI